MKKRLLNTATLLLLGSLLILFSCKSREKTSAGSLKVIFETDMGNDIDDALALDMLYKYSDLGKINLLGVSSNKDDRYSAEFIDVLKHMVWLS